MLTLLWEHLFDIISNNLLMFTILDNIFLESPTSDEQKDVDISLGVSLLEKQN